MRSPLRDVRNVDRGLRLCRVDYDHPDAVRLIEAAQRVYIARYGGVDHTPVDPAEFSPPRGYFVIGYLDDAAVACGGWRLRTGADDPALRDGDAEIKRMYVIDAMRGRGYARRILAELERTARAAGAKRMVLETGVKQPEAIALYRSAGYQEMPRFGYYRDAPGSRCFAKVLT